LRTSLKKKEQIADAVFLQTILTTCEISLFVCDGKTEEQFSAATAVTFFPYCV
jgi:hypothetical protein